MMTIFRNFSNPGMSGDLTYSQFISDVKTGRVGSVSIEGSSITGQLTDGNRFTTYSPETNNDALIGTLLENNVEIKGCLLYTSPSPRDGLLSRMPSSA